MPAIGNATTYYVDNISGKDTNNGTSSETPWQTIAKVNATGFNPGDSVLFLKGDIWREQLNISSAGTSSNPIIFDSYGSGSSKPVISGANLINPALWQSYSGNIYVAHVGAITVPTQLYVDGVYQEIARYPANSYLIATATPTDQTTVVDSNLTLTGSIVGATMVYRPNSFTASTALVTGYNSGTHTVAANKTVGVAAGYGFYFRNMLWMLGAPGQWFYDSTAGNLYLWTTAGDSPSSHTVEVSSRTSGINIGGSGNVTVADLEVTYAQSYDVAATASANVVLNNLSTYGGVTGVTFYSCATCNGTLENSSIEGALTTGVYAWGTGIIIHNNMINNTGNVEIAPDSIPISLNISGTSNTLSNNTVSNNGFRGINFNGIDELISNNTVTESCLKLDDCGAIYTYAATPYDTEAGNVVSGNTVSNSIGNMSGTPTTFTQAQGIYFDNNTHSVTAQNNIISNVDSGIYIHDGYNHVVTGNRVHGARSNSLQIVNDSIAGYTQNNTIMGNVFEVTAADSQKGGVYYRNSLSPSANFGTYNYNLYCHPNEIEVVSEVTTANKLNYNLSAWQPASGQDLQSTDTGALCPNATPPSILPVISFSASPTAVAYGSTSTLTWGTTLATSCTASGGWAGTQATSGTVTTSAITSATTYTLACTGIGGTTTQSVTVTPIINGSCGTAGGGNLTSAPTTGLCATGTASSVSGTGPWSWSCAGSNGGTVASCSANLTVNGVCGSSNTANLTSTPTAGLCSAGTASPVSGSGPWNWSCAGAYGGTTSSCSAHLKVNGAVGSAKGKDFATLTASSANLCSAGTLTNFLAGSVGWTWSCAGSNGGTTDTSGVAYLIINGSCGTSNSGNLTSKPSTGLCNTGTASSVSGTGPWSWSCAGSNGGTTSSCSANLTVSGVCGASSGTNRTSMPTTGLCNTGSASSVSGIGPWSWTCAGVYGGATASCSANLTVNGACGTSSGGSLTSIPTTNLCSAGTASTVSGTGPWSWSCTGVNGGTTSACSASAAHVVFAHYLPSMGAYGNTVAGYEKEIQQAQSYGIDGFALDMMGWSTTNTAKWADFQQLTANMFTAAANLGTGFKLFFELDCQGKGYDAACEAAAGQMLTAYGNSPNYYKYQGKPVFSGWNDHLNSATSSSDDSFWTATLASLSNAGWSNAFFIPIFSDGTEANPISPSQSYTNTENWFTAGWLPNSVKGLMGWGSLVPSLLIENNDALAATMAHNNLIYASSVQSWFSPIRFLSEGNTTTTVESLEFNGGEGLSAIWQDIINNTKPPMVNLVSWNNYTESYMGPAAQTDLTANNLSSWQVTGDYLYSHAAYTELNSYFIKWYKNGVAPTWPDAMYVFYRTAPMSTVASSAPAGTVISWNQQKLNPTLDDLYITTILTAPATLTVTSGGNVTTFNLSAGLTHTRVPFAVGSQTFALSRGTTSLINITGANVVSSESHYYNVNPVTYFGYH